MIIILLQLLLFKKKFLCSYGLGPNDFFNYFFFLKLKLPC